jgi:hypothetical protein
MARKKEPEAGHPDDRGEGLCIVDAHALTAALEDELGFVARNFTLCVRLDTVNPHVVDDHAVDGEIDELPHAIVNEGGILMLR